MHQLDFAAVKSRFPLADVLAARGVKLHRAGQCLQGPCPIHHEKNGNSFTLWTDKQRWRCYGRCAAGGDVFDLLAALDGGTAAEAARRLAGEQAPPKSKAAKRAKEKPAYNGADALRMDAAARRLAASESAMQRIADKRGWRVEAVRQLAGEGSLGIGPHQCGPFRDLPCLWFGYLHGYKLRGVAPCDCQGIAKGDRVVRWGPGKADGQAWRQAFMRPEHKRVIIAEGEMDAASLISAGLETEDTIVLGAANAGECPDPEPFRGREVILAPQADAAAQKNLPRFVAAFQRAGCAVRVANLAPLLRGEEAA